MTEAAQDPLMRHRGSWRRFAAAGAAAVVVIVAAIVVAVTVVREIERWWADRPLAHATRALAAGDARDAARTLLPVAAERPGDPVVHYYLGLAYVRAGWPASAIGQLAEAERLQPNDAGIRDALGQAYRAAGTSVLALREFLAAVALDPRAASYRAEAASLLLDDGRVEEALVHLREAVRLRPQAAEVRVLLGLALCRAGDEAGMQQEYRSGERFAAGTPVGELAHQLAGGRGLACIRHS
jgi:Flp pilus assembly protein TadD